MADDVRDRLMHEEEASWRRLADVVDRIPPSEMTAPGAGPDDWTAADVLYHLAAWSHESAAQLAAIRGGRSRPARDTDAWNAEILRDGRLLDPDEVRVELERARSRTLAEWSVVADPPVALAVEWFGESGPEHIGEHIAELTAFADRVTDGSRPGAPARRAAVVAAEDRTWRELEALIDALPAGSVDSEPVTPDGWTVKDTMWHITRWWDDFLDVAPRFADAAFDPDDRTTDEVDALNRAWFEESRALPVEAVRDRWTSSRSRAVETFGGMSDPSATAESWFVECGTTHYEKHLIDLRALAQRVARRASQ